MTKKKVATKPLPQPQKLPKATGGSPEPLPQPEKIEVVPPQFQVDPELAKLGLGENGAVQYPFTFPTRVTTASRFRFDVRLKPNEGGLRFDPTNPRLVTALVKLGKAATQANLAALLEQESLTELVPGLKITKGINTPIIIDAENTVKEGNRRTWTYRYLDSLPEFHDSELFRYIPVEKVVASDAEIRVLLGVRHIKREKKWASREEWRFVEKMQKDAQLTSEQLAELLEVNEDYITLAIRAAKWYDEYDVYSRSQTEQSKVKDDTRLWTYFWKLSNRKKFVEETFNYPEAREKFYAYVHNGQFNDCLNIDQLTKVWAKKEGRDLLDKGVTFQDVIRTIDKDYRDRRSAEIWTEIRKMKNQVKRLNKSQKTHLTLSSGSEDRQNVELLVLELQKLLVEAPASTVVEVKPPEKEGDKKEAA